ncbi:MAG: OsmC family protein [Desulfobacterales bacterium]|nr:OsmC family protein [Desulfobacterales bacterium]
MSALKINLFEKERCRIVHKHSETSINTDGPFEWGGKGRTFSPTDLVSTALGSCILSILEPVFERNGYDPQKLELNIVKELSEKPKMIKSFTIDISYPDKLEESFMKKALKTIDICPVKRSISPDVEITINFA